MSNLWPKNLLDEPLRHELHEILLDQCGHIQEMTRGKIGARVDIAILDEEFVYSYILYPRSKPISSVELFRVVSKKNRFPVRIVDFYPYIDEEHVEPYIDTRNARQFSSRISMIFNKISTKNIVRTLMTVSGEGYIETPDITIGTVFTGADNMEYVSISIGNTKTFVKIEEIWKMARWINMENSAFNKTEGGKYVLSINVNNDLKFILNEVDAKSLSKVANNFILSYGIRNADN